VYTVAKFLLLTFFLFIWSRYIRITVFGQLIQCTKTFSDMVSLHPLEELADTPML